ncbi:MAG: hypothetical protein UY72_C0074G0006 [Candidatus Uhrbacteria bacterium GW2011_GWD2_52_7]|uniref:STAS domain-containing protein n=1 Tax=Candidatus Uhrbacteria bacterium GW2011_GWD2_52_7 TaxID=1618989 RepID=A0A0G2A7R8_9BACT|nr:MAG: hypothetical protein UY72_C0074G0006 [Candidatus Uhrbacteria bacterium GW2011_GWD2_52_7]
MHLLAHLRDNWKSGVTVALVSIPLSVSLAVASESTPTAGIITAIWAGLLAAIFGGSHYNIVGPTGALSGILATYAIIHGAHLLPMLAIMAGVFILLAYAFKLEKFLVFVPGSAIHGFTLGVAFIIAFNQMNFALGLSGLTKHEHFVGNLAESFKNIGATDATTALMFGAFLALMFVLLKYLPRVPGAIILAPIGILLGYLSQNNIIGITVQTLGSRYPDMTAKLFEMPSFAVNMPMVSAALAVALVAILETMLSAKIADGMTKTKHDKRKEMLGLGIANIASGMMGGIPATAALARTSLNIKSGANHRASGIVSAIAVAVISVALLATFKFIPLAVIAAILVFVAVRMIERHHFARMWKHEKKEFVVAMIVAFVTVYEDPIIGILLGVALALLMFMEKISRGQFELIFHGTKGKEMEKIASDSLDTLEHTSDVIIYSIRGQLAYINSQSHVERFQRSLNGYKTVIIRLRELAFIDLDGVEAFNEIVEHIWAQHKQVIVTSVHPLVESVLKESPVYQKLLKQENVFQRTSKALDHLGY